MDNETNIFDNFKGQVLDNLTFFPPSGQHPDDEEKIKDLNI